MTRNLPVTAFGGVLLALGVFALEVRLDEPWGDGALLLAALATAALLLTIVLAEDGVGGRPALLIAGLGLTAVAIYRLAEVLGSEDPISARGTLTWGFALLALIAFAIRSRTGSGAALLIAVVSAGAGLNAAVAWIFDPHGTTTFRALLLGLAALYALAAWRTAPGRDRDVLAGASGLALLTMGLVSGAIVGGVLPDFYEAMLLVGGLGLMTYALLVGVPGPAVLSALVLTMFLASVISVGIIEEDSGGSATNATLAGWPVILLVAGIAGLAYGLTRARRTT